MVPLTDQWSIFSAPGKVLFSGGYLVLDREFTGLVYGLDARIHVAARRQKSSSLSQDSVSLICVQSPQFLAAEWLFECSPVPGGCGVKLVLQKTRGQDVAENRFVQVALTYAITYAISQQNRYDAADLSIVILADSSYYSNCPVQVPCGVPPSTTFPSYGVSLEQIHKTGLGSSAAVVTALVAAVLDSCLKETGFNVMSKQGRLTLHRLCQAAHCAAQGKIGSGFDVAAAVFGSCQYRRFSPEILRDVLDPDVAGFSDRLLTVVQDKESRIWDEVIAHQACRLPLGLGLIMCDVDCGSATVGMVKKLLSWRKDQPTDAHQLWTRLECANKELATLLHSSQDVQYDRVALRAAIETVRKLIREMSAKSKVPIEPEVQTNLIDCCMGIPGVIGGIVPGAGGYDAIALLVEDREITWQRLQDYFRTSARDNVNMGPYEQQKAQCLNVKQDNEGIKAEAFAGYVQWLSKPLGSIGAVDNR